MRVLERTREMPRWVPPLLVVLSLAAVALGVVISRQSSATQTANAELSGGKAVAEEQRDATAGQALDLAVLIEGACSAGTIPPQYTAACLRAEEVRRTPVPGRDGAAGLDGSAGVGGRDGVTPACLAEQGACRGADGAPGRTGGAGLDGRSGADGIDGIDGRAGLDGLDGRNGRDGGPGCDAGTVRDPAGVCVPVAPPPTTTGAPPAPPPPGG